MAQIYSLIVFAIYYRLRPSTLPINTFNKYYKIMVSIGAIAIPLFILLLSDTYYYQNRGRIMYPGDFMGAIPYYEFGNEIRTYTFLFELISFMLFFIYYDKGERSKINVILIIVTTILLWFLDAVYLGLTTDLNPNGFPGI
jgi:hypothetical protein